jgi:hypothetical protein
MGVDSEEGSTDDEDDNEYGAPLIYYNPNADIVYFRPNSCEGTLSSFLQAYRNIPRVAINIRRNPKHCYWDGCVISLALTMPAVLKPNVRRIARMTRILHGFEVRPCHRHDRKFCPGCGRLREIIWVVNTTPLHPWGDKSCEFKVDESVRLLPMSNKELACNFTGQKQVRKVKEAVKSVKSGQWHPVIKENRWVREKKPLTTFQCFGFQPYSSRKLDRWFLQLKDRSVNI